MPNTPTTADQVQLSIVKETTRGTTPATPAFDVMRFNSETLAADFGSTDSAELSSIRGIVDTIPTQQTVSGAIEGYGCDNDVYLSLLAAIVGDTVPPTTPITAGHTLSSFTVEKRIPTGSATYDYLRFVGCTPTRATINSNPGQPVTWSFDFVGGACTHATTAITGATYTAPQLPVDVAIPYNAAETQVTFASSLMGLASAEFTSCQLVLDGQVREIEVIDNSVSGGGTKNITQGRLKCSASLSVLFQSLTSYQYLTNPNTTTASATIGLYGSGSATGSIVFNFGKAKPSAVSAPTPGTGEAVVALLEMEYIADETGTPEQISIVF